ncbi:spore germination protein [Alkaliphilus peptidifermentans]|uniref:Spore germination protein KA n=1 Tax=Alkaliphilus peptidifermentans DSM 18978 TaxID=1120976 RepID=A0A1G5IMZ2_9FIRM|nr:spore germination protein [Alkaliphilus peptidifermentans]SCY76949.1 spore germination protein KA [Alkaliphilus peptidifermentans DSM 18978]
MKIFRNLYIHYIKNKSMPAKFKDNKENLSKSLKYNLVEIQKILGDSDDIIIREFKIGMNKKEAFLLYIDGLVDKNLIVMDILKPLMLLTEPLVSKEGSLNSLLKESVLTVYNLTETSSMNTAIEDVLSGYIALFIDKTQTAIIIKAKEYKSREIQEAETEAVIRGPRESFTESLRVNTSLIRRKVINPNLRFETYVIGKQTKTKVCLTYIKGICKEEIISEVKKRLEQINTEAILESGYIEAYIEDAPFSPFPTIGNTEKPDKAVGYMLEGKVIILTDGTPVVLSVPHLFIENFQNIEDYYSRPYYATLTRLIRFIAFILTIYLPGFYVGVSTFHPEMIPSPLLMTMAETREGVPFPLLIEALVMLTLFEILREAGVRMPRPIGQAVSIVGALVIGEAAVAAGIVGAPMVIVTALTAISSFIVPSVADIATLLRFAFLLLSGITGLFSLVLGSLFVLVHAVSLRSFGIPYLAPVAPFFLQDMKDFFARFPLWALNNRPASLENYNIKKQDQELNRKRK